MYTPGFTSEQRAPAVVFSRFFLPQILFYRVSATAGAVLNIRGRFAAPMWAPLVNSGAATAYALRPVIGSGYGAALSTLTAAGVIGTAGYVVVARLVRLTELRHLVATALATTGTGCRTP